MPTLRAYLLLAGLLLTASLSFAQTQGQLNATAYARYQKADQVLNRTYQAILKQYRTDTLFIQNLNKAQRLWLQLRTADLRARYPEYESGHYGSFQPVCESDELTALTEARTRQLRIWLTGVPEGEMCTGSVKFVPEPKRK
ncbi:lysozyme inhibitor LprI family protein [Spirosoma rhododendri]|uniref:DUF1311 domain-containing protein n=1 Tax=Spirosoma rhododendri TaxID=2728024 RepID=A0A7L5DWM7_9BACT|nr:lysozyme inhibitor LprI family protein [Spirosoma rhododendri]QJD80387.1 DUF1311 domain-containing protein [Spirosoma rhododendri]